MARNTRIRANGPKATPPALGPRLDAPWLGCFAFPHEVSEQRTPRAAATQQAASDEQAQQPALPASAFVLVVLAFILVFVFTLAALA